MKVTLLIFVGFSLCMFVAGLVQGNKIELDENFLIDEALKKISVQFDASTNQTSFTFVNNTGHLKSVVLAPASDKLLPESDPQSRSKSLFPLNSDDVVLTLALSALGITTLKELPKEMRRLKSKRTAKHLVAVILGTVSGYSLGFNLAKPELGAKAIDEFLSEEGNWRLLLRRNYLRVLLQQKAYIEIIDREELTESQRTLYDRAAQRNSQLLELDFPGPNDPAGFMGYLYAELYESSQLLSEFMAARYEDDVPTVTVPQ